MLQHREVPTIAVHSQAWWRPFVLGIDRVEGREGYWGWRWGSGRAGDSIGQWAC